MPADESTQDLLAAYALTPPLTWFTLEHAGKNNINLGLHTGSGSFVVRSYNSLSYDDPAAIDHEHQLLAWLATQNLSFAVPTPLPTLDGTLRHRGPHGWQALVPLLPGTPLALQPHDGAFLGAALGELQATLRHYPAHPRPGRPLYATLFDFSRPARDPLSLTAAHLGLPETREHDVLLGWWREEAALLHDFVGGRYRELPRLMCHNDITPNNLLAQGGRVTAVLDFEYATPTPRALDFSTGLRIILRHWEPGDILTPVRPFCRAYARWIALTEAEIAALPHLLRLRGACTVLWWLGHTDSSATPAILNTITYLRNLTYWLDGAQDRLMEIVRQELLL